MNPRNDKPTPAAIPARLRAASRLRPLLGFLRRHLGMLLLWPAIGLAAGVLLWSYVLSESPRLS